MSNTLPLILIPGLVSSPRVFAPLIPALWQFGPVTIANHIRDHSMAAIAARILSEAPERFALAGHSMGGYIAFEIMRQVPGRVAKLALLNSSARPDTQDATARRKGQIARARAGEFTQIIDELFPTFVHPDRSGDASLRAAVHEMAVDVGTDAFVGQQMAIMGRADSRPLLASIACPTLVMSGDTACSFPIRSRPRSWTAFPVRNC